MEIIKSSGTWWFPEYITTSFGEPPKITNSAEAFSYDGIIIYDGVTFYWVPITMIVANILLWKLLLEE